MKNQKSNNIISHFKEIVDNFETKRPNEKIRKQNYGVIYTPKRIVEFIVNNIFKIYIKELVGLKKFFKKELTLEKIIQLIKKDSNIKEILRDKINCIKILDPACGSGRFLLKMGIFLLQIYKILKPELNEFDIKKQIIQNVLFGNDIDKYACLISKLRLLMWLYSTNPDVLTSPKVEIKNILLQNVSLIISEFNIDFNIFNLDYLLKFDSVEKTHFDFIIGNPPYIENKKIIDQDYKKELYKNFSSTYKLFDLSIVFIEKSINLLKDNGYVSFLLTNKFLSADYGVKIRELLIKNTELKEIINISSLPIFNNAAAYPIIMTFKKGSIKKDNQILIKKFKNLNDLNKNVNVKSNLLPQNLIEKLPANVIPVSGKIDLIRSLYPDFKSMSHTIPDIKIIYRPFGFTKWAKYFENISETKVTDKDLLLLGTGNVGKFHIKFDKRIKIAKKDLNISYFNFNENFKEIWKELCGEKLIFREIAKDLTWVYDPGIYVNITGLYFVRIPSFGTNKLFCLLTIMNSKIMDLVFKTFFSTLHMSGGFLRFNGSFIRRLPMPNCFPESLSYLGKIIQFLSQLNYLRKRNSELGFLKEIYVKDIEKYLKFFKDLANSLVYLLYFKNLNQNYLLLDCLLKSKDYFPNIQFKYILPRFNTINFKTVRKEELKENLGKINNLFSKLAIQPKLIKEMKNILKK